MGVRRRAVLSSGIGSQWYDVPTRLLESGYDIRTVREPLRHRDVRITMVYAQGLNWGGTRVRKSERK